MSISKIYQNIKLYTKVLFAKDINNDLFDMFKARDFVKNIEPTQLKYELLKEKRDLCLLNGYSIFSNTKTKAICTAEPFVNNFFFELILENSDDIIRVFC